MAEKWTVELDNMGAWSHLWIMNGPGEVVAHKALLTDYPKNDVEIERFRLMASAPALLEACKSAHIAMVALGNDLNWNGVPQSYADAINAIRAAIAQAEVQDEP